MNCFFATNKLQAADKLSKREDRGGKCIVWSWSTLLWIFHRQHPSLSKERCCWSINQELEENKSGDDTNQQTSPKKQNMHKILLQELKFDTFWKVSWQDLSQTVPKSCPQQTLIFYSSYAKDFTSQLIFYALCHILHWENTHQLISHQSIYYSTLLLSSSHYLHCL